MAALTRARYTSHVRGRGSLGMEIFHSGWDFYTFPGTNNSVGEFNGHVYPVGLDPVRQGPALLPGLARSRSGLTQTTLPAERARKLH